MICLPNELLHYLCDDILDQSSLKQFSQCNQQFRQIALPSLFRDLAVTFEGSWEDAGNRTESLLQNKKAAQFIRSFRISVFVSETPWKRAPKGDRMSPLAHFPSQLCQVIKSMTNLETLAFVLPEAHSNLFEEAFTDLQFPSITQLSLSPYYHFLISKCPSLRVVRADSNFWLDSKRGSESRGHTYELLSVVSGRKLDRLSVWEWWTTDLTTAILQAIPNVPDLHLPGGRYKDSIHEHIPILAKFTHLTHLHLADAGNLRAGFERAFCGNVYFDFPGFAELEDQQERETEDKIVRAVASQCRKLNRLGFYKGSAFEIRRDESGEAVDFVRVQPDLDG